MTHAFGQELATSSNDLRVKIIPTSRASDGTVFLVNPSAARLGDPQVVLVSGELVSSENIGRVEAEFRVRTAETDFTETLPFNTLTVDLDASAKPFQFEWMVPNRSGIEYTMRVRVRAPSGRELAHQAWRVLVRDKARVDARLATLRQRVNTLREHYDSIGEPPPAPIRSLMALANHAIERPKPDVFHAAADADMAARLLKEARAGATFLANTAPSKAAPVRIGPDLPWKSESLARSRMWGFSSMALHRDVSEDAGDLSLDAGSDVVVRLVTGDVATIAPTAGLASLARQSGVRALYLPVEPRRIRWTSDDLPGFVERIKKSYPDRYELNRLWKQHLLSYDEIEIWPTLDNPAYQFDWQTYHRMRVTADVQERLKVWDRAIGGGAPVGIALPDNLLEPGTTRFGIDPLALTRHTDTAALISRIRPTHMRYAANFGDPEISIAVHRAFAAKNSLSVFRHYELASDDRFLLPIARIAYIGILEAALAGADNIYVNPRIPGDSHGDSAEVGEAAIRANLDMKRFGNAVDALKNASGGIGILWSHTDLIQNQGASFLTSVRSAFEGASFSGLPVQFLTETDVVQGAWPPIDALVIPRIGAIRRDAFNSIVGFVESGIPVIRTPETLLRDEHGIPLEKPGGARDDTLLIRGDDTPYDYVEAIDEFIVQGRLPAVPRPVNAFGYPIEGVRALYATREDTAYLYLVNLRSEPTTVELAVDADGWTAVATGQRVSFPRTMDSLEMHILARAITPGEQVATAQ